MQQMAATITERSKTLINNDLKKILKEEGTSQTGNKAALQARVIGRRYLRSPATRLAVAAHLLTSPSPVIANAVARSDTDLLRRLQYRVQHHGEAPPPATSSPVASSYSQPPPPIANGYSMANGYQSNGAYQPYQQPQQPPMPPRPTYFFKESPFFEIRELILSNMSLDASPTHRATISRNLTLNESQSGRLKTDPSLRLLLFSALEQPLAPFSRLDIAFPSQIEVKVNDDEVKANYKGLKNKPGSTRPADITDFVRTKVANQRNSILITYALTQKASRSEVSYPISFPSVTLS